MAHRRDRFRSTRSRVILNAIGALDQEHGRAQLPEEQSFVGISNLSVPANVSCNVGSWLFHPTLVARYRPPTSQGVR